jgi:hypothetical protein
MLFLFLESCTVFDVANALGFLSYMLSLPAHFYPEDGRIIILRYVGTITYVRLEFFTVMTMKNGVF